MAARPEERDARKKLAAIPVGMTLGRLMSQFQMTPLPITVSWRFWLSGVLPWQTYAMAKPIKQDKRPTEVNELANYLVTESARELEKPDRPTDEQVSLIMAESEQKTGATKRKTARSKAARTRLKNKRKP